MGVHEVFCVDGNSSGAGIRIWGFSVYGINGGDLG